MDSSFAARRSETSSLGDRIYFSRPPGDYARTLGSVRPGPPRPILLQEVRQVLSLGTQRLQGMEPSRAKLSAFLGKYGGRFDHPLMPGTVVAAARTRPRFGPAFPSLPRRPKRPRLLQRRAELFLLCASKQHETLFGGASSYQSPHAERFGRLTHWNFPNFVGRSCQPGSSCRVDQSVGPKLPCRNTGAGVHDGPWTVP